jgi:hypothetical protein
MGGKNASSAFQIAASSQFGTPFAQGIAIQWHRSRFLNLLSPLTIAASLTLSYPISYNPLWNPIAKPCSPISWILSQLVITISQFLGVVVS